MAKIAKAAAKKGAKSLKKASKKMKKQAKKALKSKNTRSLYTEAEKKRLKSLRSSRSYYNKKAEELNVKDYYEDSKITLQDIRGRLSKETAYELNQRGYFNSNDYFTRDFREWMISQGDHALLLIVMTEVNATSVEDIDINPPSEEARNNSEKLKKYTDRLTEINEEINKITDKAEKRKMLKQAKALAERAAAETGLSVAEILDKSDKARSFFTDPERATILSLKSIIAKEWMKAGTEGIDDPDEKQQKEEFIYTNVMQGPLEGFRYALKSSILENVTKEYGEAAAPYVGSLVDLATGLVTGKGGSVKGVIAGAFESFILDSNANPELMKERSEELVNLGKSTMGNEAAAGLARDVLVDIAKDVIMSGGNLVTALPKVVKDVVFDTTKAAIGYHGNVKEMQKEKAKLDTKFSGDKVISKDEFENRYFKQLDE